MSFELNTIVRSNVLAMEPYSSARDEFDMDGLIMLDANENPYGDYNRYPDPYAADVRSALAIKKEIRPEQVFTGNGSDEAIDLLIRIFCRPGMDKIAVFTPGYGMYKVSAELNDIEVVEYPLDQDFQPTMDTVEEIRSTENLKLVFLCSPNNPTGNLINSDFIQETLSSFNGIVVVDEAYIDFAQAHSWVKRINTFRNLVVLQTLSKSRGLAGIRTGMAFANEAIVQLLDKVKPPYNVNSLSQVLALDSLLNDEAFYRTVDGIIEERSRVAAALAGFGFVVKVYGSNANFLLVEMDNANLRYQQLIDKGIVIRNRNSAVTNCVRITIGSTEENDKLLTALKEIAQ